MARSLVNWSPGAAMCDGARRRRALAVAAAALIGGYGLVESDAKTHPARSGAGWSMLREQFHEPLSAVRSSIWTASSGYGLDRDTRFGRPVVLKAEIPFDFNCLH